MIQKMLEKVVWLGHASFRIHGPKIVYFDPYQITDGPKADLILISHEHFDHCSPQDVDKVRAETTVIVTEKDSAGKLSGDVRVVKPGDALSLDETMIHAVPAYNLDKAFHPKKNAWLGFIVEMAGVRIYHSGDSDYIPEMNDLHADIALLPVSGTYVMTWEQAAKAALAINPKVVVPMHYGAIVGEEEDAISLKRALEGKIEVVIPSPPR
jgi:L-ascorbate metabolism protein UlaG (beta-lactamase superfamily)